MKKGNIVLLISLIIVVVAMSSLTLAAQVCSDGSTPTQCVCGHTPNSSQGYGQVVIGGFTPTIISCNNIADGVCPEDFMNPATGLVANCSNCPDSDCTVSGLGNNGWVEGFVRDSTGRPIAGALVTSHPIKWNSTASLEKNVTTNTYGYYNFSGFITGSYYFSASKDTYDTQLYPVTVSRGVRSIVNFILLNGTCHEDCTNSYNRCNAACDGISFANGSKCTFYNSTVKSLCNNRLKGTEVYLGPASADSAWFIECCGNQPATPYEKYYAKADTNNGNIKNLIKIEKISKYNDIPVRVVIAYWQP